MNCQDINQAIVEGIGFALPPEAEEHLRTCARCRERAGTLEVPVPADLPSPTVLREIERGLVADLRPVRPIAPKRYIWASFLAIFVVISFLGVYHIGAFAMTVKTPLQMSATLAALATSAGLLAYLLMNQMVPGSRYRFPPGRLPIIIVISLMIAIEVLFPFQHERHFWAKSLGVHPDRRTHGADSGRASVACPASRCDSFSDHDRRGNRAACGSGRNHRSGDSLSEPGRVAHPGIAPRRRGAGRRRRSCCRVGSRKPETDSATVTFLAAFANKGLR